MTSAPRVSDTARNTQRRRTFPATFRTGENVPLCCYGNTWVGCLPPTHPPPHTHTHSRWLARSFQQTHSCEALYKLPLVLNLPADNQAVSKLQRGTRPAFPCDGGRTVSSSLFVGGGGGRGEGEMFIPGPQGPRWLLVTSLEFLNQCRRQERSHFLINGPREHGQSATTHHASGTHRIHLASPNDPGELC